MQAGCTLKLSQVAFMGSLRLTQIQFIVVKPGSGPAMVFQDVFLVLASFYGTSPLHFLVRGWTVRRPNGGPIQHKCKG